jgi:hypothetical protein
MATKTLSRSLALTHPDLAAQAIGWDPNSVKKVATGNQLIANLIISRKKSVE